MPDLKWDTPNKARNLKVAHDANEGMIYVCIDCNAPSFPSSNGKPMQAQGFVNVTHGPDKRRVFGYINMNLGKTKGEYESELSSAEERIKELEAKLAAK